MNLILFCAFLMILSEGTPVRSTGSAGACQTCHCVEDGSGTSNGNGIWSVGYSGSMYSVAVNNFSDSDCRYLSHRWTITNLNTNYTLALLINSRGCTHDSAGPYTADCSENSTVIKSNLKVTNIDTSQTNSEVSFSSDCADINQCAKWEFTVGECNECSAPGISTNITSCGYGCAAEFTCKEPKYTGASKSAVCQEDATWNNPCHESDCSIVTCSNQTLWDGFNSTFDNCISNNSLISYDYNMAVVLSCPNCANSAKATCVGDDTWTIETADACNEVLTTPTAQTILYQTTRLVKTSNVAFVSETNVQQELTGPQIAGIVIGSVAGVGLIGGLAVYVIKR